MQVTKLRYGILMLGMLYIIPSLAITQQNNTSHYTNNQFTELSVYNDRQVAMTMINTKDGPQIITAYADNNCDVHGQLSVVQSSTANPENFSYLTPCISTNSADNIVLKKDNQNNMYLAYTENGPQNQIHLKWMENGNGTIKDFDHAEQLLNKNPLHLNLALDSLSYPVIVYTATHDNTVYLNTLKYTTAASGNKFVYSNPNRWQVNENSIPRVAYDLSDNLYIAYVGITEYKNGSNRGSIGLIKMDNQNNWNYINNVGNLSINNVLYYDNYSSNAFDLIINNNRLYLEGVEYTPNSGTMHIQIFTYDTQNQTFNLLKEFYPNEFFDISNLRLLLDTKNDIVYSTVINNATGIWDSYFALINGSNSTIYNKRNQSYRGPGMTIGALLNDGLANDSNTIGYVLSKDDDEKDLKFAYRMDKIKKSN